MRIRGVFIMACAFMCISLPAQNVQPTISDPEELAIAQQQKEEIFKQLFKDPTNLSLLFKYANISILVGDLELLVEPLMTEHQAELVAQSQTD